jgi:membrane-associated phospholipid phosphatase
LDQAILLWVHSHATPALDAVFRVSHELGTFSFCLGLVLAMAAWHLVRHEPREATAWIAVGLAAWLLPDLVKLLVARPRPALWPWLVHMGGPSFPSGHAVVGGALYPLLAWDLLRPFPRLARVSYALGFIPGVFVSAGRLYLGVHWPSDVWAGLALGTLLSGVTIAWLERGQSVTGRC